MPLPFANFDTPDDFGIVFRVKNNMCVATVIPAVIIAYVNAVDFIEQRLAGDEGFVSLVEPV